MAYSKRNKLERIIDIQSLYLEKQEIGLTPTVIFRDHIYPLYKISRTTFYNYLNTNAKRELAILDTQAANQISLFPDEEE